MKMEGFLEYYFSDGVWGRWPDLEQRGLYALLLRVDKSRTPMDGRRSSSAARLWVAQMFQALPGTYRVGGSDQPGLFAVADWTGGVWGPPRWADYRDPMRRASPLPALPSAPTEAPDVAAL